jgi:tRNA wybutosine-synthesizing protein 3
MMKGDMVRWEHIKEQALLSLREAIKKGLADEEILPLLELINSKEGWVTSSSCAGRIVLIRKAGEKGGFCFPI